MPPKERTPTTQFVLDIWAESAEPDRLSWRGKVVLAVETRGTFGADSPLWHSLKRRSHGKAPLPSDHGRVGEPGRI